MILFINSRLELTSQLNTLENPLGCYEPDRYEGNYQKMINEVMTVFEPQPFP